jgi:hypothetical protein
MGSTGEAGWTIRDKGGFDFPYVIIDGIDGRWLKFIAYCAEMGDGMIARLHIEGGVPVKAECVTKEVNFETTCQKP